MTRSPPSSAARSSSTSRSSTPATAGAASAAARTSSRPMTRPKALLVDDDARLGKLVAEYLGKNEVEVTVASDGERGLAQLAARPFDVVLLDLMLPGIDGLEVCRRIRAGERKTVPV